MTRLPDDFWQDWHTDADDDMTVLGFIGAGFVLGLLVAALIGWTFIAGAAR